MFLPQGMFSTEFPLFKKKTQMLRCASESVAKGQRLLCYQYKTYLSAEAWGVGGGWMSFCQPLGYVCARFEVCGLVVPTGSEFVELFLIGW